MTFISESFLAAAMSLLSLQIASVELESVFPARHQLQARKILGKSALGPK